jgi:hypothetical protein
MFYYYTTSRTDMGPGPSTGEVCFYLILSLAINLIFVYFQPFRVGAYIHTTDERFCWIKCKTVLFKSPL